MASPQRYAGVERQSFIERTQTRAWDSDALRHAEADEAYDHSTNQRVRGQVIRLLLAGVLVSHLAAGQSRPDELRLHLGIATFFEAEQHFTVGGSYRKYFGKRGWGIEPEYSAMVITAHTDHMLAASIVKDLSKPTSKRVWYILMGGGINHQRRRSSSSTYWPSALAWGVGMKARLGKRVYVAPQVRIGWEPNIRFSVFFGRMTGKVQP